MSTLYIYRACMSGYSVCIVPMSTFTESVCLAMMCLYIIVPCLQLGAPQILITTFFPTCVGLQLCIVADLWSQLHPLCIFPAWLVVFLSQYLLVYIYGCNVVRKVCREITITIMERSSSAHKSPLSRCEGMSKFLLKNSVFCTSAV